MTVSTRAMWSRNSFMKFGQEHHRWSARDFTFDQSQEKGPYRIDLASEETGIGQI
jgi:hypothetical protein